MPVMGFLRANGMEMPDPTVPTWLTLSGVGALFLGGIKWMLGRQVARIDDHDDRIQSLEKDAITKADLDRTETRITAALADHAGSITERIGEVRASTDKAHERIDRIMSG